MIKHQRWVADFQATEYIEYMIVYPRSDSAWEVRVAVAEEFHQPLLSEWRGWRRDCSHRLQVVIGAPVHCTSGFTSKSLRSVNQVGVMRVTHIRPKFWRSNIFDLKFAILPSLSLWPSQLFCITIFIHIHFSFQSLCNTERDVPSCPPTIQWRGCGARSIHIPY